MEQALNRYDHLNIRDLINGYMVSKAPNETAEQFFERAKAELIANLETRLGQVRQYSFQDFSKKVAGA